MSYIRSNPRALFTFGSPRVGNQPYRDRVLSSPGKGIFRYVNLNDTVAHVPLESFLYRHAPDECLRFDENGVLGPDDSTFKGDCNALRAAVEGTVMDLTKLDTTDAPMGVVDHSPARYCIRLWNCL